MAGELLLSPPSLPQHVGLMLPSQSELNGWTPCTGTWPIPAASSTLRQCKAARQQQEWELPTGCWAKHVPRESSMTVSLASDRWLQQVLWKPILRRLVLVVSIFKPSLPLLALQVSAGWLCGCSGSCRHSTEQRGSSRSS